MPHITNPALAGLPGLPNTPGTPGSVGPSSASSFKNHHRTEEGVKRSSSGKYNFFFFNDLKKFLLLN